MQISLSKLNRHSCNKINRFLSIPFFIKFGGFISFVCYFSFQVWFWLLFWAFIISFKFPWRMAFVWFAKRENSLNLWGPRINITTRAFILRVSNSLVVNVKTSSFQLWNMSSISSGTELECESCTLDWDKGGGVAVRDVYCYGRRGWGGEFLNMSHILHIGASKQLWYWEKHAAQNHLYEV